MSCLYKPQDLGDQLAIHDGSIGGFAALLNNTKLTGELRECCNELKRGFNRASWHADNDDTNADNDDNGSTATCVLSFLIFEFTVNMFITTG